MKKNEIIAVLLIVVATVGTIAGVFLIEKYVNGRYYNVELIARAPDNGNWYPSRLEVPFGREIKLRIRNIETVSHGFAVPDLGVGVKEIKAGEVVVVRFNASKRGVFPFMCTVWCSTRHMEMDGELVIK